MCVELKGTNLPIPRVLVVEGKGREGKGREGNGMERKGRDIPRVRHIPTYVKLL